MPKGYWRQEIHEFSHEAEEDKTLLPRRILGTIWQSMLLLRMPNLREACLHMSFEMFLAALSPGALSELKLLRLHDDGCVSRFSSSLPFDFIRLKFLAQVAPNLATLSLNVYSITFATRHCPWTKEVISLPIFLSVKEFTLDADTFGGLEDSAVDLISSFPLLRTFRFGRYRQLEQSGVLKLKSLLNAIRHQAKRLKHSCLDGVSGDVSEEQVEPTTWVSTIQQLSKIRQIEVLTIDSWPLWPFRKLRDMPSDLILSCLPPFTRHLHLESCQAAAEHLHIRDWKPCLLRLIEAINHDSKFSCLKMVSVETLLSTFRRLCRRGGREKISLLSFQEPSEQWGLSLRSGILHGILSEDSIGML